MTRLKRDLWRSFLILNSILMTMSRFIFWRTGCRGYGKSLEKSFSFENSRSHSQDVENYSRSYSNSSRCQYDSFHWKCYILQSTRSINSDCSVSRGTNSNGDFGLIWICTEEWEFLDLVNFGGVAISVESVIAIQWNWRGFDGMCHSLREVGGWGRVPFSRNFMSPTPRRKRYLTTGRRAH